MPLLERVGTLLRANINDLIDKAEDPQKLARQLLLDMENQLLQVKTQVAIAIADQHLLAKKQKEHEDAVAEWRRKAEIAVNKGQDDLARGALERSLSHERLAAGFAEQCEDQKGEAEMLRSAFTRLQGKLAETRSATELLLAQRSRTRTLGRAHAARSQVSATGSAANLQRLRSGILDDEAANLAAQTLLASESLEDRFAALETEDRVEALLESLKNRQPRLP